MGILQSKIISKNSLSGNDIVSLKKYINILNIFETNIEYFEISLVDISINKLYICILYKNLSDEQIEYLLENNTLLGYCEDKLFYFELQNNLDLIKFFTYRSLLRTNSLI